WVFNRVTVNESLFRIYRETLSRFRAPLHTLYFSQNAYDKAKEPKELHIIPGASHIDLYYKPEYTPQVSEKLTEFFGAHL
ncbi:alpha/beta hydrolase, partial [Streptomyces mirabilis]|nr:alpha/beta hydrolase [Streptomyces mirabilis]